jgi:hypothetical protein
MNEAFKFYKNRQKPYTDFKNVIDCEKDDDQVTLTSRIESKSFISSLKFIADYKN